MLCILCLVHKYCQLFIHNNNLQKAYFGPGGLRAPCVLACAMRSLAIVITIVQTFSPLFFSGSRVGPCDSERTLALKSRRKNCMQPQSFVVDFFFYRLFLKKNGAASYLMASFLFDKAF